jgi:hypothetical protein
MTEFSVAEGVLATAYYDKKIGLSDVKPSLGCIRALSFLPGCKKLEYNKAVCDLVDKTRSVDTEEILAQLNHVSFPFDRFWVTGPSFSIGEAKFGKESRLGFLVDADQKTASFKFSCYFEEQVDYLRQKYVEQFFKNKGRPSPFINGNYYAIYDSMPLVTPEKIDLDVGLMEEIESFDASRTKAASLGYQGAAGGNDLILVDKFFNAADFLVRLFTVMSALNIQPEMHPDEVYQQERLSNLRRQRNKFPPKLTVRPILIDITKVDAASFDPQSQKELRQLLGWTSVRRSREIVSKYGKIFRRKPHDRRIAAPEDRRNAVRQLTAGETGSTLALSKGAPTLSRPGT